MFLITFDMQLFLKFTYLFPWKNYVDIYNHFFAQLNTEEVKKLLKKFYETKLADSHVR